MNRLATLLKEDYATEAEAGREGEGEAEAEGNRRRAEELEVLLRSFSEDEIGEDEFAEVSLEDPVLLLLAQ
jgi:hypothetical protein